jgi:hypothetical protein
MRLKSILFIGLVFLVSFLYPVYSQNNPFVDTQVQVQGTRFYSSESGSQSAGTITGIVRAKWLLNVRAGPWGKIIDGYKPGVKVQIVAKKGDWYKIIRGNGYAYVHTSLIEVPNKTIFNTSAPSGNSSSGSTAVSKIFDLVKKFCKANKAYVLGAAHKYASGIVEKSDCSGFTGQFIQKLSALAGVKPVTGGGYPSSTNYANSKYTDKVTSSVPPTKPRDLVKPATFLL